MENTDLISRAKLLDIIKHELAYQERHATPGEDIDTGIICGLRKAAEIVKGIGPVKNTQAATRYYPELVMENVNGFKDGYMEGVKDGRKAKEQAIVLIKSTQLLHSADLAHIYNDLVRQKDKGVIMLQPGLEYIGTIPEDADIELVVKKVKEAQHEKD